MIGAKTNNNDVVRGDLKAAFCTEDWESIINTREAFER